MLPCERSWGTDAKGADAGPLVISVPEGFDGPIRSDEAGGSTTAWVKRRPGTEGGTLLQVSAVDVGASLEGITAAERAEAARHYLLEFLKGIGQGRGDFELGEIEPITLAGLPAVRVRWTGILDNTDAVGMMYCVVVGHTVVDLNTQDVGSTLTPAMYSAMNAIEGVRVR
jgi:hypothetical protein